MRTHLTLPIAAMALTFAAPSGYPSTGGILTRPATHLAQAQTDGPPVSSERTVNLTEEQRHTIREIVLKDRPVQSEAAPIKPAIGDVVPSTIVTYEFPAEAATKIPALKSHTYFVKNEQIVVVDAKDRKIADVVKQEQP